MINVDEVKKNIINILKEKGPLLPYQLARQIEMSSIFASAILSELLNERRIKLSNMRIGSSPLYLLPGDEKRLEPIAEQNLDGVEKDAFLKLKQEKILYDEQQSPAIRTALRSIKDFAKPLQYQGKIIWKYSFVPDNETRQLLKGQTQQEEETEKQEGENKTKEETEKQEQEENIIEVKKKTKKKPKTDTQADEFLNKVKDYLLAKDIEFLKEIETDKKQVIAVIRINSDLGKIKFLMTAKNKKRANTADLTMAYHKASNENMPCYFLSRGEPASTTEEFIEQHKNLLKTDILP